MAPATPIAVLPPPAPEAPVAASTTLPAARPPHTRTESTLAPTSEFMRYVLAALPSRYVLRGLFALGFNDPAKRGNGLVKKFLDLLGKPGDHLASKYGWDLERAEAAGYNASLGLGSLALTASYTMTVYKDIKNIFSEAVAAEFDKPIDQINFKDISRSQNRIVKKTLDNFWGKLGSRLLTDALFIPAAFMRKTGAGDLMLGFKGVQLFADTWKRKTTMFEDLITFVNNKINPRNGLGQPIGIGEIFDLYQHYSDTFHPNQMFTNVLERGTGEGARWAQNQPIFQRMTELMNQTYAYKHNTVIDPETGHAVHQANFPLPTFIYLLGHDLIDVNAPEKTLAFIEIANRYGIPAVKAMQAQLRQDIPLATILAHYPIPQRAATPEQSAATEKNGVIAKGSTMQLEAAPPSKISLDAIAHEAPRAALEIQ